MLVQLCTASLLFQSEQMLSRYVKTYCLCCNLMFVKVKFSICLLTQCSQGLLKKTSGFVATKMAGIGPTFDKDSRFGRHKNSGKCPLRLKL